MRKLFINAAMALTLTAGGVNISQAACFTPEELREIQTQAESGNAEAQKWLGILYYHGETLPQDAEESVKWYTKASESGDSSAQLMLAFIYYLGDGVRQNYKEAFKWYTKSAEQGNAWAEFSVGMCYQHGTGVGKDLNTARNWYMKACNNGLQFGCEIIKKLEK